MDNELDLDGCVALANAIVAQAMEDYRAAIRGMWDGDCRSCEEVMNEIVKFVHSKYFSILTKINGDYIIKQLQDEYANGEKLVDCGDRLSLIPGKPVEYTCPNCGGTATVVLSSRNTYGSVYYNKSYTCANCKTSETRHFYTQEAAV